MTRMSPSLLMLAVIGGCAAGGGVTGPVDVSDRLAAVEAVHASAGHSPPTRAIVHHRSPAAISPATAASPPAARRPGDPPVRQSFPSGAALSLGDAGDPPPPAESEPPSAPSPARVAPLPSFWDTLVRDVKALPRDLWSDTQRVYANPVNLVILGTAYGGSIALQQAGPDDTVERHFNRDNDFRPAHHHFKEDWRDAFGAAGNPGTHFALAGVWYLLGQQTGDTKTYEVGRTLFSALTINGVTVLLGQAATYDRAPNGEYGTFPSGHTSSSFVLASVMHQAYGHLVGAPLYGLAALVAMERVEDGEHYLSDVCMGAVLGTVVGHSVASGRDPEFFGWKLLPYASPQSGSGIAFMKTFE